MNKSRFCQILHEPIGLPASPAKLSVVTFTFLYGFFEYARNNLSLPVANLLG
ncbi:MAG: hypothetical protein P0116_08390 [Candidatus Nitrosocosmicus sp.]|nr:hypothetical protein [Candidatus Nitrosocosmicus sp.]